jgi:hypothetical protein
MSSIGRRTTFDPVVTTKTITEDENGRRTMTFRRSETEHKLVHLDASQRVVALKDFGILCAEPSPDAISSLSSSFGLAGGKPNSATAELAAALSTSVGSIGLRTQSIQLMRDGLYRVCEAYYNRAIDQIMVMQLLTRFQDVMAAILAIEQLTGPTVGQQLVLTTNSTADSLAEASDLVKLIESAREDVSEKQTVVKSIKANVERLETALASAETARSKVPAEDAEASKQAQADVDEAKKSLDEEKTRLANAEEDLKDAQEFLEVTEARKPEVFARTKALSSGSAEFASNAVTSYTASQSVTAVAKAVESITTKVLEKDHAKDSCLIFLIDQMYDISKDESESRDERARSLPAILNTCIALATLEVLDEEGDSEAITSRTNAIKQAFEPLTQQIKSLGESE